MKIIFAGTREDGYFAEMEFKGDVVYLEPNKEIQEHENEILKLISSGDIKGIIYDIDQYMDDSDEIIKHISQIKEMTGVTTILFVPSINPKNIIVRKAIDRDLKFFISKSSNLSDQRNELVRTLTGFYNKENLQEDVIDIEAEKKENKKDIKTIGFAGSMRRIGTTTQAIQMAKYLQLKGYKSCIVEMNTNMYEGRDGNELSYIEKVKDLLVTDFVDEERGVLTISGIDMLYKHENFNDELKNAYDYLIYDYGVYSDTDFNRITFLKEDIKFFVVGSEVCEIDKTYEVAQNIAYKDAKLIFSFTGEGERDDVIDVLNSFKTAGTLNGNRAYFADYTPNPYILTNTELFEEMLSIKAREGFEKNMKKKKRSIFSRGK